MSITIECPFCHKRYAVDESASGQQITCKSCGGTMQIPDLGGTAQSRPEPQPEPEAETQQTGPLPRQMRANRTVAGRTCPVCGQEVQLGQPVRNCELCGQTHHDTCWQSNNGCGTRGCDNAPLPALRTDAEEEGAAPSLQPPPGTRPCPHCGEPIAHAAVKCRHCGEYVEGQRPPGAGGARPGQNSGMAIGSLVCGILGFACCPLTGPAAIVLGIMARREIRASGGRLGGDGMALAGIILGSIGTALAVLGILAQIIGALMGA
ncbi:MAG: DUF4190 domain-containing protein [bacterium]